MSNNRLLVDERQADIGSFLVGRLLPFRKKRQVGPFTFIDHMGPAKLGPDIYVDVDQHPHIGLSTLTYLFEGEIEHRDSMGTIQPIQPGDVGFMTAGSGVTHTERTPFNRRNGQVYRLHGYQVWVALPTDKEEMAPRFDYWPKSELPSWDKDGLKITLVAGEAFGYSAPLKGYSPLFMLDIYAAQGSTLRLADHLQGELAFVIVKGSIRDKDSIVKAGQMLISKTDEQCEICLEPETRLLLFGGQAMPQEHFLLWNFVSSDKEKLKEARQKFPKVPGDDSYIPFPEIRKGLK